MQFFDIMKQVDSFEKIKGIESTLISGNTELCLNPEISIIIPTYNRPEFLKVALESALSQIQPVCNYEVIVVDNEYPIQKPTPTERLLRQYQDPRLLYYQNPDIQGMVNNWNRGIQLARAKWVALLHDDDILLPDYVNKISRLISRRRDIAGITVFPIFLREGHDIRSAYAAEFKSFKSKLHRKLGRNKLMRLRQLDSIITLSNTYFAPSCGTIFRKDKLIESGGFDETFYPSFDWFFLYRYSKKYKLYRSVDRLGYYRMFGNTSSLVTTKTEFVRDIVVFAEYIAQRTRLGWVMRRLFANEQFGFMRNIASSEDARKIVDDYFQIKNTKERKFRKYVYHKLTFGYMWIKEKYCLLFG